MEGEEVRNNMSTPQTSATLGESNQVPISIDENQSANSTPITLGETDRHRSIVWNHFKRKTIDGKLKAECNDRKKLLVGGAKNGTTHLHDHLKSCGIRVEISKWLQSPNEVIKDMALNMLEKFNKYWSVIHGVMGIATVLDPRYKLRILEYYYEKMYGDVEALNEVKRIKELCLKLVGEYEARQGSDYKSHPSPPPLHSDIDVKCPLIDDLSDFDKFIQTRDITKARGRSELDRYLEDGMMPRSSDFDILSFWKTSGPKYPLLQMIAKDLFAIPVSTVASESAFSTSGRVISPHRNRLLSTTVEALMCSQSWLSAEERGSSTSTGLKSYTLLEDLDIDDEENDVEEVDSTTTDSVK